ncbi:MAG TPA: hypothetical protein VMV33_03550 [Rhodocyclaceae bacterium]|nr:hypothetical protein [Rhodocyclaceae bacterium]
MVWADEGVYPIKSVESTPALASRISAEAETRLGIGAKLTR